ncbi:MAG: bifunctional DNA-formamidopyrimidine glycosylase/DNA-(apurinic or apyrimidinic site) lyase [Bdellovibrionia bacterium]
MPELPEVEVVKRGLSTLLNEMPVIQKIKYYRANLRDALPSAAKTKRLQNAQILEISRRAKYLIFHTTQGKILSHLGMTGSWRVLAPQEELGTHDHVEIELSGGQRLIYRDPRRFGVFDIFFQETHPKLSLLGPEPWDEKWDATYLKGKLKGRKATIKVALMDQKIVVGVGNIYASEALFLAGISPLKSSQRVTLAECQKVIRCVQEVLENSIEKGGSTISDFVQASGESGYFQMSFKVYGREGELCLKCKQEIIRQKTLAGRSTFWCPKCQLK